MGGVRFTVHGQCHDNGALECSDSTGTLTSRIEHFRANCACAEEQHYRYRWDELNRLVEGLRYDRATGGSWTYGARMRYRYDGANQRTIKQSFAATSVNTAERYALYVYPGDFERRGLILGIPGNDGPTYLATTGTADATETQYLIAGARLVWDAEPDITGPGIDRNRRATVNASDLLGTTAASIDLESGALLEVSTYYPNGARENLWANEADVPLEPMGFTGKEADEEIGVTYFGERWLIPRLGRWATPDPLHVHAAGGGEALNSYHYVSGNLLQARDPLGLQARVDRGGGEGPAPPQQKTPTNIYAHDYARGAEAHARYEHAAQVADVWNRHRQGRLQPWERDGLSVAERERLVDEGWLSVRSAHYQVSQRAQEKVGAAMHRPGFADGFAGARYDARRARRAIERQAREDASLTGQFAQISLLLAFEGPGLLELAVPRLGASGLTGRSLGRAARHPDQLLVTSPPAPGQVVFRRTSQGIHFEGHGERVLGTMVVPEGVWLRVPNGFVEEGVGQRAAALGDFPPGQFTDYGPGSLAPRLVLHPPDRSILFRSSSTRVTAPTLLEDMLAPGDGFCVWAACNLPGGASGAMRRVRAEP